jgi:transmembrane sensor
VRTTVLGTAFNIKADGSKVVVSVTRGKVRVEDASKVLAVLTPDQQVEYNVPAAVAEQQTVDASTVVTDWTKEDMVFNGISFAEIAEIISKRYGTPVMFRKEALKSCKIMASFSGTETLDQVASVLSGIRNGSYEIDKNGTLWLDGESCE